MMTLRLAARAATAALALCLAAPAFAYQPPSGTYAAPDESDLDNHHGYVNRDGQGVHSPAHSRSGRVPEGASAQCRDGTYSFSRHHSGTCSRHGGVAQWL
ncbi:DUF3761 domain-containing protein [Paraburkholderia bannensis]